MTNLILNTKLCRIANKGTELQVLILMQSGEWLEHQPFPNDLQGLASALDLALNVVTGKFYPRGIIKQEQNPTPLIAGGINGQDM